jgi:hypothetical protein
LIHNHYIFQVQRNVDGRSLRLETFYKKYEDLLKTSTNLYRPVAINNNGSGAADEAVIGDDLHARLVGGIGGGSGGGAVLRADDEDLDAFGDQGFLLAWLAPIAQGAGQEVLRAGLGSGNERGKASFAHARQNEGVGDDRLAFGNRAGFVENHGSQLGSRFQCFTIADIYTALGLATPTAIMVGTGQAAKRGIYIRNGEALETAAKLTTVVFDKTGTITEGKPVVTDAFILPGMGEARLALLISAAEAGSEHFLARALGDWSKPRQKEALIAEGIKVLIICPQDGAAAAAAADAANKAGVKVISYDRLIRGTASVVINCHRSVKIGRGF